MDLQFRQLVGPKPESNPSRVHQVQIRITRRIRLTERYEPACWPNALKCWWDRDWVLAVRRSRSPSVSLRKDRRSRASPAALLPLVGACAFAQDKDTLRVVFEIHLEPSLARPHHVTALLGPWQCRRPLSPAASTRKATDLAEGPGRSPSVSRRLVSASGQPASTALFCRTSSNGADILYRTPEARVLWRRAEQNRRGLMLVLELFDDGPLARAVRLWQAFPKQQTYRQRSIQAQQTESLAAT